MQNLNNSSFGANHELGKSLNAMSSDDNIDIHIQSNYSAGLRHPPNIHASAKMTDWIGHHGAEVNNNNSTSISGNQGVGATHLSGFGPDNTQAN